MTGRLLLKGNPPPPVHFCDPPERGSGFEAGCRSIPLRLPQGKQFEGALWECDCGQAWHCENFTWCAVPPRMARKILKRAARS